MSQIDSFKNITFNDNYKYFEKDPFVVELKDGHSDFYQKNLLSNILKEKHLSKIVKELNKNGIKEIALLKGIYLLKTLYADRPWIRNMSDIDILVKKKDYQKAKKLIYSKYRIKKKNFASIKSRHEFGFYIEQSFVEIHKAQSSFNRFKIDYDSFFKNADKTTDQYKVTYRLPSFEKTALFSIIHNFSQNISELDIRRIIETEIIIKSSDKNKLLNEFKKYKILHLLSLHSAIYSQIVETPRPVFDNLKVPKASLLLHRGENNLFSSRNNKIIKILLLLPSYVKWSAKVL